MRVVSFALAPAICALVANLAHAQLPRALVQVTPQANRWGGVIASVDINPRNSSDVLIGAGNGGAYRSSNGGRNWARIVSLPVSNIKYVSFSPRDPNIILVAAAYDTKTAPSGGIWRSNNGGATWLEPMGSIPLRGARCPERAGASAFSWVPGRDTVWAATDCGLLRSDDQGASWRPVPVDPASPAIGSAPDRMITVLAIDETHLIAGGDGGYYTTRDGGAAWERSAGVRAHGCPRSLAVAPGNPNLVFRADFETAYLQYSANQGRSWENFPSPELDGGNIGPFVRTTTSPRGPEFFELYYGTGVVLKRATLRTDGSRIEPTSWEIPPLGHWDPHDLAFDPVTKRPAILVGDGGVMFPNADATEWMSIAGPREGLNALEILGLGVQNIGGEISPDVTFVSWHNWTWYSAAGALTWVQKDIAEGFNIKANGPYVPDARDARLSMHVYTSSASLYGRVLTDLPAWTPPHPACFRYIDFFKNQLLVTTYFCDGANIIYNSQTIGSTTFRELARNNDPLRMGYPHLTARAGTTSFYHAFFDGSDVKLSKLTDLEGSPVASTPNMQRFGNIAISTYLRNQPVFGVKADDDRILIAADRSDDKMKRSIDGGDSWNPHDALTDLVTDNKRLRFYTEKDTPQATVIAFDPTSTSRVMVGTIESGVLYSADAGDTWTRIDESFGVKHVTDIRFDKHGVAYVATAGYGLWRWPLHFMRFPRELIANYLGPWIRDPRTGATILIRDIGDPEVCPACTLILARAGHIDDFVLDQKGRLTVFASNPDSLMLYASRKDKIAPQFLPAVKQKEKFAQCAPCRKDLAKDQLVNALILENGKVRAYASMPKKQLNPPDKIIFAGETKRVYRPEFTIRSGVRAPGYVIAKQGEKISLTGTGFAPAAIAISLNGRLAAEVKPDAKGSFKASIALKTAPGISSISCVQEHDGTRIVREQSLFVDNHDDD